MKKLFYPPFAIGHAVRCNDFNGHERLAVMFFICGTFGTLAILFAWAAICNWYVLSDAPKVPYTIGISMFVYIIIGVINLELSDLIDRDGFWARWTK